MSRELVIIIDGEELDYEHADVTTSLEYVNDTDKVMPVFDFDAKTVITVTVTTKKGGK